MRTFLVLKSKGDKAFHDGNLLQAISYYTDALAIEAANQEVLGCRSAVYSKLGMHNEAKKDAERLIITIPHNPKGYFIKAVALENLSNYTESLQSFLSAYERDSQHPLELVLNIIQVSGCICQPEDDQELNLSTEGYDADVSKFEVLVWIGKRFCKNKEYNLCNAVLKTALVSHCSFSKSTYWLQDHELKNSEQGLQGDNIIESTAQYSSMYVTIGFHGDGFHGNLDEAHVQVASMVDSNMLMSALITLCLSYYSLKEFRQALIFCEKCLQLALECGSKKYELKSYVHLANIYQKLGDYLQAISYNGKLLAIGRDLVKSCSATCQYEKFWNISEECKALWNLSQAYKSLGDLKSAMQYANECLDVSKTLDEGDLSTAYANLGELELVTRNLDAALDHYNMALRFAKKVNDKVSMSYSYGNIGNVYAAMGNKTLSEVNHGQHMKLAQSIGDDLSELVAMKQMGDMYRVLGNYSQALQHYEKYLMQVKVKHHDTLQCCVYSLIGLCYWKLNQLYRAQHNYEISLKLARELCEKEEELNAQISLAKIMKLLRQYETCRKYFNEVIPVLEHRLYVKQGSEVVYEDETSHKLSDCYEDIQEALVEISHIIEALEISEHCNSRVFVNMLRRKEVLRESEGSIEPTDVSPSTAEEIFKLVDSCRCLVLVYSRLKDGFISWLLSPGKGILKFYRYRNCDHKTVEDRIKSCIEDLHRNQRSNYNCDQRSLPSNVNPGGVKPLESQGSSCFTCRFSKTSLTSLQRLHEMLITPFKDHLTNSNVKALTVIPAEMMTMVPFPSLQDSSGDPLYQNLNVTVMPCIRSLSLSSPNQCNSNSNKNEREIANKTRILVAGNPTIPDVTLDGTMWHPCGKRDLAEKEVASLATLLGVEPVTGSQATTEHIKEMLAQSSLAHLVTYGSWKKGCLAFAPNPSCLDSPPSEDTYLITISDLLALDLTAKLIVISSCYSCSHDFSYLKQMNLSLATALMAAGAQCVVYPLWSVEQTALIRFYSYFYLGLEKGESVASSLKEAHSKIKSLKEFSDPIYWSSVIMLGFDTTIDLPRLRYKLFSQILDHEVMSVVQRRFTIKAINDKDSREISDELRKILTSLMLQHGSMPDVLPTLRHVVTLANSMLSAYEEGQNLSQVIMSTHMSSKILDAPFSRSLLVFLGFSFQSNGAKKKDPYIVFPHWDYENVLDASAVIFNAVSSIFDVSAAAGHLLARLLKDVSHVNMERLRELLAITTKYPIRIVKTSDFMVRSLWCNNDVKRFLLAIGFYEVGQSLLFNKSDDNQTMVKGAHHVFSALLGHITTGTSRVRLQVRELSSDSTVKLVSLSPLVTASNKVVMGTPWMSKRAPPSEDKLKLKFAKELETINKDFSGVVTRSNYWHAKLLRAQTTQSPSLPVLSQSHPVQQAHSKKRVKVKVVSGLTPSCDRRLADEEPKMTLSEAREQRNAIYQIYGQRFDDITMRKRNEIRQLFVSLAEETK